MTVCCISEVGQNSGGCVTETDQEFAARNRLVQPTGKRLKGSLENGFKPETKTSLKLFVEVNNCCSRSGPNFSWRITKPPMRMPKTHEANLRAIKHLQAAFGSHKLACVSADEIEIYLRRRLKQHVQWKTATGLVEGGSLKPATVHQEFRVLRRILNVGVRKKLLAFNPCAGVEFPMKVKGMFRPHYVSWSEQQRIESHAPPHLRNAIRIITETGLRVYKELTPMKKDQVDIGNAVVWISDSKTPNGVAEVPLTELAVAALREQMEIAGSGPYVFPSDANSDGHQLTFKTAWAAALRRSKVPYFRIYDLRSTYATRLSAGGVADEWVTQLLRQGDAKVFKKYSQMKLQMKREALQKLHRHANESRLVLVQTV